MVTISEESEDMTMQHYRTLTIVISPSDSWRGIDLLVLCFFFVRMFVTIAALWDNSCSYHQETFKISGQCNYDHAVNFAVWQHPAIWWGQCLLCVFCCCPALMTAVQCCSTLCLKKTRLLRLI